MLYMPMNNDCVLSFISRRFDGLDAKWLDGNCFYFAKILESRFPDGEIYYDVIDGHFVFKYRDNYYDYSGKVFPNGYLVEWDNFEEYDALQKKVIIRDCIL